MKVHCYRLPYKYKRIEIPVDTNRPNPRYKVKWEIDKEKAEIGKKYLPCAVKNIR